MTFNPTVIKQNKDIEDQTVGAKDKNWISMIPGTKKLTTMIEIIGES